MNLFELMIQDRQGMLVSIIYAINTSRLVFVAYFDTIRPYSEVQQVNFNG